MSKIPEVFAYLKAIAALVVAVATSLSTIYASNETLTVIIAIAGAVLVFAVPNDLATRLRGDGQAHPDDQVDDEPDDDELETPGRGGVMQTEFGRWIEIDLNARTDQGNAFTYVAPILAATMETGSAYVVGESESGAHFPATLVTRQSDGYLEFDVAWEKGERMTEQNESDR